MFHCKTSAVGSSSPQKLVTSLSQLSQRYFNLNAFFYSRNVFLHVLKELKFYVMHFNTDKIIFYKLTSSSNLFTDVDSNLAVLCFIFALFLFYLSLFGTFGNSTLSFVYSKNLTCYIALQIHQGVQKKNSEPALLRQEFFALCRPCSKHIQKEVKFFKLFINSIILQN